MAEGPGLDAKRLARCQGGSKPPTLSKARPLPRLGAQQHKRGAVRGETKAAEFNSVCPRYPLALSRHLSLAAPGIVPNAPLALAKAWPDWQSRSLPLRGDQCLMLPAPGAAAQMLTGVWKCLGMGAWHTWYRCPALAPIPGGDGVQPAGRLGIHALAETPGQPGWGSMHRSRPRDSQAGDPLTGADPSCPLRLSRS